MKVPFILLFVTLPGFVLADAPNQPKPRFRDAATHEQLSQALRKSERSDPMKNLTQAQGEDPSKVNQPVNLLEQSDIISFNGLATLVPKRAILATPASHKQRVTLTPGSRIVSWADFYALNRGWITTVEVSRVQAEGNLAIAEETQQRIGKSTNLVVATYKGGPISVLPLKQPVTPQPTAPVKP